MDRIRTPSGGSVNRSIKYDAAGRQVETLDPGIDPNDPDRTYLTFYDGNGWKVKSDFVTPVDQPTYEIRSTVLGGEMVGTHLPRSQPLYQHEVFIAPVLGGKLTYTKIINYNETTVYTRDTPEGTDYDPRGGKITEEPVQGGDYPSGGSDPSVYTRCSVEGGPTSCDMQARFNQLAGRIEAITWLPLLIWRDQQQLKTKAEKGSSMAQDYRWKGPFAHQLTASIKSLGSSGSGGVVLPPSLPCIVECRVFDIRRPGAVEGREGDDGFYRLPPFAPQTDSAEMIHCGPEVAKRLEELKDKYRIDRFMNNGVNTREFGFAVSEDADGKMIVGQIVTSNKSTEVTLKGDGKLIAAFHTHPIGNLFNADPSKYDVSEALRLENVNYVLSNDGDFDRLRLFNGNEPKTPKGKERIVNAADCPKPPKPKKK